MIAFCTTCKSRAQHLRRTLPQNIADNETFAHLKFIVLDYGSPDDTLSYMRSEWSHLIDSGRVVVYSYRYEGPFHMAHAKNMAHRCGILEGADVLVNMDADNYTGNGFARYVADQFWQSRSMGTEIFLWANMIKSGPDKMPRGSSGRIAVTARTFINAGGYDEQFNTYAPDDKDFNARMLRMNYQPVEIPRQYLEVIPHGDKLRFKEYPHVTDISIYEEFQLVNGTTSRVVNHGNIGCGIVYKNFEFRRPIRIPPIPTRIFGIGLHKTATSSLHRALKILGYDSAHWESGDWAKRVWMEMKSTGRSAAMERYYAISDLPVPILYEQLDRAYPNSKFILTVRDESKWLTSVRNHWDYDVNSFRWEWDVYPFSNQIHKAIYGQTWFDERVMLERYRRHNAEVREYFRGRRQDLLVMDHDKRNPSGWRDLCGFLGKPIPDVDYPVSYVTRKK